MLDHLGICVSDMAASRAFYSAALAPLGYAALRNYTKEQTGSFEGTGFGVAPKPDFWIGNNGKPQSGVHICFQAKDRATVDAFYRAAMAAGAKNNGAPGIRAHYHANYYGAFVYDPDGNNVEACCHLPE